MWSCLMFPIICQSKNIAKFMNTNLINQLGVRRHIESKHMFGIYLANIAQIIGTIFKTCALGCHLKKQHSITNNDMMEIINLHVKNINAENIEMCYQ